MFCERVLGNLDADPIAFATPARQVDELELAWWELDKRALRKVTPGGREVRILLPIGQFLAPGDVIHDDGAVIVVVRLAECEALVVRPRSPLEMGCAALEIGNLHAPAEVIGDEIIVVADGPVEGALNALGIPYERTIFRLHPRRCAGMPTLTASPRLEIRAVARD
ncbi:MAG TPA: urease accessory protein UreE [Humisphaera sp.]|nr:urease accessory protein UreE [Humisphaera sp.]